MSQPKTFDLTDERSSHVKVILQLTWPLVVEQVLATLVSYADTAMVGALGVNATASVSISNSFVFLINGVVMSLGVGITTYVARSVGAKDYEAAKSYIRHAILLLLYVGLPLSLVVVLLSGQIPLWMGAGPEILGSASQYLLITSLFRVFGLGTMMLGSVFRGRGDTKTPLRINMMVNIINVVGNYLLIHPTHTITLGPLSFPVIGAGMGVAGAALSTGFSWLVGCSAMIRMLYMKDDPTKLSIHDSMRLDRDLLKRVISISVPAMLERFSMSAAGIVVTKAVASLGTMVIAANSIYITAESISFMPGFAFATAATTLVGQSLGANKVHLAKKFTYTTVAIGAAVLTLTGAMLYIFARQLVGLFTPDQAAIALSVRCLRIVAFIQPIQVTAWILAGALRGAGDTRWPFYITLVCNWGFRSFGAWLCIRVLGFGLPEAVFCTCVDGFFRALLTFMRFRSGKWQFAIKQTEPIDMEMMEA